MSTRSMSKERNYQREIIQDISLCLIREHDVSGDGQSAASHQRYQRRYMRHLRKAVERWSAQASIDQERVMVANWETFVMNYCEGK